MLGCGPFCRAAGIRRSGSPDGRINSVFSFKVLACCTANARGFFFKTVVAGGHAVHAWRCFAPYAIALKCALFLGITERLKALLSTTYIFKVPGKREGVSFDCVGVFGL